MGDGIDNMEIVARDADTERIYELLQQYPSVLQKIDDLPFAQTPLHITVQRMNPQQNDEQNQRYVEFALEMMNLKPSFSRKLNPSGLSPIHLAVQNYQTLLVRELLKIDKDLARVKGKGGQTPLHFAADHEALDLLVEFLEACPECITDVNIQGQTAFHFAVKNKRYEAAKIMASWIRRSTLEYSRTRERAMLNMVDQKGNTVLHIAALNNDPQMVRLLLNFSVSKDKINLKSQTALDISEDQRDSETIEILRRAKCPKASTIPRPQTLAESLKATESSFKEELLRGLKRQRKKLSNESLNVLLVVYALIVTTTYQACLSPPGGFTQENSPGNFTQGNITDFHNISSPNQQPLPLGVSALGPAHFNSFYSVNTLTFGVTVFTMTALLFLKDTANYLLIYPPLILLIICYSIGVSTISPTVNLGYSFLPFIVFIFFAGLQMLEIILL